ncbi:hypothetical protein R6Q57_002643 [Mikania cordata]
MKLPVVSTTGHLLLPDMSSDEGDDFDELPHHPWLQFPQRTVTCTKRYRLLKKSMGQQKAIDYDLLTQIGARERMTTITGEDTPWSRLFEMCYAPQYRLITFEFLSTFIYRLVDPDFEPQPDQPHPPEEISFRLCGESYDMSLREFAIVSGLYTEEDTHMPIYRRLFQLLTTL